MNGGRSLPPILFPKYMLASTKRRQMMKEGPPNKIAGFLYVWIGVVGLFLAAFVLMVEGKLGQVSNFRIGLGAMIALWGIYRIITGIMTVRKANRYKPPVVIEGGPPDAGSV
jgi:succinate-acetate transporter protein